MGCVDIVQTWMLPQLFLNSTDRVSIYEFVDKFLLSDHVGPVAQVPEVLGHQLEPEGHPLGDLLRVQGVVLEWGKKTEEGGGEC